MGWQIQIRLDLSADARLCPLRTVLRQAELSGRWRFSSAVRRLPADCLVLSMVAVGSAGVAALFLVRLEEEKRSVFATVTSNRSVSSVPVKHVT